MDYKEKPFYLEFPIFRIAYILFWIPIGYYVSNILSIIIVSLVFKILVSVLYKIYSFAFELFVISGRLELMINYYYFIATIIFDFILLIAGLELISYFLNKKKVEEGFDKQSNDNKN